MFMDSCVIIVCGNRGSLSSVAVYQLVSQGSVPGTAKGLLPVAMSRLALVHMECFK